MSEPVILIVEDEEDDYILIRDAFESVGWTGHLCRVKDGWELMDFLLHRGQYQDPEDSPTPQIILLDLNMPSRDGRETLKEIKSHPRLRRIPVVVLTASSSKEDIMRSYELGVSSYIRKPIEFGRLVQHMEIFKKYWFEVVQLLPPEADIP